MKTCFDDPLTKDELSASSREEFVSASKSQRAPHSLRKANCDPEKGKDERFLDIDN